MLSIFFLDNIVKGLYQTPMETKKDLVRSSVARLLRIAKIYARIEELPIPVGDDDKITTKEAHAIQAIGDNEDINITDLGNHFGITKSAASQMVTKLVKGGYVTKDVASHSNKEYVLSLTKSGWEAYEAHEKFHGKDMEYLVNNLENFSLSQIATISVLLESMGNVMDERLKSLSDK